MVDPNTINKFISKNDTWDLYRNCSWFTPNLWNSVSDIKLSALNMFGWSTPEDLANSIIKRGGKYAGILSNIGVRAKPEYKQGERYYTPRQTALDK